VATITLPKGLFGRTLESLRQGEVLLRLALSALAALLMWAMTSAWAPPFEYHKHEVPTRNIVARVDFEQDDPKATEDAQKQALALAPVVYVEDPSLLVQLRSKLINTVDKIVAVNSLAEFGEAAWEAFQPPLADGAAEPTLEENERQFKAFQEILKQEGALLKFKDGIAAVFTPLEQRGLLTELPKNHQGNQEKIFVYTKGQPNIPIEVDVSDILIGRGTALQKSLAEKLTPIALADRVFAWLFPQLPSTLSIDEQQTKAERKRVLESVKPVKRKYVKGQDVLAKEGDPLNDLNLDVLRLEHAQVLASQPAVDRLRRSLAALGMYIAMYTLCGLYIGWREPILLQSLPRFFSLLVLVVATVALCQILAADGWNAEIIPLLLFGMTLAIAYHQELALLLSFSVALIVVFSIGDGLSEMVILASGVSAAVMMLKSIRTRSKLLYVGIFSGAVVLLTTVGVGTLLGRPLLPITLPDGTMFYSRTLIDALRFGLWAVIAGSLMTCLLPFIEKLFDVQTDISLIELGDPAHPLLQELIRRAPGTYNHSITVASLSEAAAESIGARGLLVRVGAYFHDIGKMLKPGYFIENQSHGINRHESLVPAMSTLVIIAHVKDGADLARQHHLPERIIDFIQQHHGTTLVEYFFRRANEQREADDPNSSEIDESAFRYPGPKPQSKEAGVMMLADAVESASRVLVEPTPARIESLVKELAMKRLLDGQFDECGLTLQEVHTIQESLVKSLTAVYHGRVKYPGQRTA
jgi:putative nucleotidyltransferase with HDIG domain